MRVYIPYWHIIFTNESIVTLMAFKNFVMYCNTCNIYKSSYLTTFREWTSQ